MFQWETPLFELSYEWETPHRKSPPLQLSSLHALLCVHHSACVQIHALTEQLSAMHAAWRERDARQKGLDGEMKDMAFQLQQAQLYATLATTRIQELSAELVSRRK